MASRYSILARNTVEYEEDKPPTEEDVRKSIDSEDVLSLRADVRRLKIEIERLVAERDSAEAGERAQRVRADRAERMNTGLSDQLGTANGQISSLMAQLDSEKMSRHAAEAVGTERAIHAERLMASIPQEADMAPVIAAVKEMATTIQQKLPAQGPLPTFELHFKRGPNGLIQSPVNAIPKGA